MASYTVYTIEFESEAAIPSIDDLPEEVSNISRECHKHENYICIVEDIDFVIDDNLDRNEIIQKMANLPNTQRLAVCRCNNTTDTAEFTLYKCRDDLVEIYKISDSEASEPVFSTWDIKKESGTYGEPSRELIKEKYNFDAWTIWQIW